MTLMRSMSRRAVVAALLGAPFARALSRVPYGGRLRVDLPLSLDGIDPHAADDPVSALLAPAIADTLFAWDGAGRPYPVLARSMPERIEGGSMFALRPGLVTARGRALDAADVVGSLERARRAAARPLLSAFGAIRRVRADPLAVELTGVTPEAAADALSSPVTALVPRTFSPKVPDGSGAFSAELSPTGIVLSRNERAARGPSFLDRVDVRRAADLASGLRSFESGEADVGFLGAGLHRRRADAVDFRADGVGWILFRTGPEAGEWAAPGVAARLVALLDPSRLAHLGLSPPFAAKESADPGWGGAPMNLYVDEASPYMVEVARTVAAALSRPGHELRPSPLPHADLVRLRNGGRFGAMIDFARRFGPTSRHVALSLLVAANPRLRDEPPHLAREGIEVLERTLSIAVLGELRIAGAHASDIRGLEQWDLGSVFRSP